MTLSYTELKHVQSHHHMPVKWVWSIKHRNAYPWMAFSHHRVAGISLWVQKCPLTLYPLHFVSFLVSFLFLIPDCLREEGSSDLQYYYSNNNMFCTIGWCHVTMFNEKAWLAPACDYGKLQSDWYRHVWNTGTTPYIASHQMLSSASSVLRICVRLSG